MPQLTVGARTIEYDVRTSQRARRKRIEVSPGRVQVIVPESAGEEDVRRFVESRRRWIHDRTEEVAEEVARLRERTPEGYHSGAKLLFRGRYLSLRVQAADVSEPELTYRTGFRVRVPRGLSEPNRRAVVESVIRDWFDERLLEDAWFFIRRHDRDGALHPRDVRIKDHKTLWGSCGRDRIIRLDRKLIRVPKPVLEYVVVHEMAHLRRRDHGDPFWRLVKEMLPDYEGRKRWLEVHEVALE